ncbi:hypothetical protein [Streptomyces iconiensis]|uniref:Uncharacterized protein n=1 Tax=Streptomyces iconiensis TaxID=1384038 RepID=A0ABT6ZTQ2_9ACTN|nr:hypothetical protein [Streptomyces iconiensis]MDJ1132443.1 hypothetical protein [Streptomyces iconiensis]
MSAREEIAARLWQVIPSSDDAEAHAAAGRMLDAYRAEVLREAEAGPCDCAGRAAAKLRAILAPTKDGGQ